MTAQSCVTLGLALTDEARGQAIALFSAVLGESYNVGPPPPSQLIFTATQGAHIVGTLGVDFGNAQKPLPLEAIYEFNYNSFAWKFDRDKTAQFGRWATTIKGIAGPLNYVAASYALWCQKTDGLGEVKEHVGKRLVKLGVELHYTLNAKIALQNIPHQIRPYYRTLPLPRPCTFRLKQMKSAMESVFTQACSESRIVVEASLAKHLWV
jgi:hypothetical protein